MLMGANHDFLHPVSDESTSGMQNEACDNGGRAPIRVLVVAEHPVIRAGLLRILDVDDIEAVGEVDDVESALAASRALEPDVVLLDMVIGEQWTLVAIREIEEAADGAAVIVLSDEPHDARFAFGAGASGYLAKEMAVTTLVDAVREVARGRHYLDPELGVRLLAAESASDAQGDPLTGRERELVRLLALGLTCAEAAAALGKSVRMIEAWRSGIMSKLGLHKRSELVRYALTHRLLQTPPSEQPPPTAVGIGELPGSS